MNAGAVLGGLDVLFGDVPDVVVKGERGVGHVVAGTVAGSLSAHVMSQTTRSPSHPLYLGGNVADIPRRGRCRPVRRPRIQVGRRPRKTHQEILQNSCPFMPSTQTRQLFRTRTRIRVEASASSRQVSPNRAVLSDEKRRKKYDHKRVIRNSWQSTIEEL